MTNATELAKAALDREQAEREEEKRKVEAELEEVRERVASCLSEETWEAIGIDPKDLTRAARSYDYSYIVPGETEVDGERVKTALTVRGFRSDEVRFHAAGHAKNLQVLGTGYPSPSKYSERGQEATRSIEEKNQGRVGEVLLGAVFEIRRKREEAREAEIKRIREKIEAAAKLYDRNAYEHREGVLRSAAELAKTSPVLLEADREELARAAEEKLVGLAKVWEEQEERKAAAAAAQREKSLEVLIRLQSLDIEHRAAVEAYEAACKDWAEQETRTLWRPWAGRKIRYVPRFATISEWEEYSGDMSAPVEEVFVADGALVGKVGRDWLSVVDRYDGSTKQMFLGAVLDETLVEFTEPKTDEPLDYHRTYKSSGGRYRQFDYDGPANLYVNVPPFVAEEPADPPEAPITWSERTRDLDLSALPEPVRGYARRGELDFENYTCSQLADEAKTRESAGFYDSGDVPF